MKNGAYSRYVLVLVLLVFGFLSVFFGALLGSSGSSIGVLLSAVLMVAAIVSVLVALWLVFFPGKSSRRLAPEAKSEFLLEEDVSTARVETESEVELPVGEGEVVHTGQEDTINTPRLQQEYPDQVAGGNGLYWFSLFIESGFCLPRSILIFIFVGVAFYTTVLILSVPLWIVTSIFLSILRAVTDTRAEGMIFVGSSLIFLFATLGAGVFSLLLAYSNLISSILAKFGFPSGESLTRWALGAREPSRRERELWATKLGSLVDEIPEDQRESLLPSSWYVIDSPIAEAFTVGSTIYVNTGLIETDYLSAVVAGEIGAHRLGTGQLLKAIRNFTYPFFQHIFINYGNVRRGNASQLISSSEEERFFYTISNRLILLVVLVLFGGISTYFLSPRWASIFRDRQYISDRYAVSLGQGNQLIQYLEYRKQFEMASPFWSRWTAYPELRIDNIRRIMEESD